MKEYSVSIKASAREIFNFFTDKEKFKEWITHLEEVVPDDSEAEIGLGYKFIEKDSLWGIKKEYHDEIFEFQQDKVLAIKCEFKDKVIKFRYTIVSDDSTVKEREIRVTPILNENFGDPEMIETFVTDEENLFSKVILEAWTENSDGTPETLGERALDYFIAREGVRQLRKLKKLIEGEQN